MYRYRKIYLLGAVLFLVPALSNALIAYVPSLTPKLIGTIGIISNVLSTTAVCEVFAFLPRENIFARCGPDYGYSKTLTVVIVYVLPGLYFVYKFLSTKEKKSRWREVR